MCLKRAARGQQLFGFPTGVSPVGSLQNLFKRDSRSYSFPPLRLLARCWRRRRYSQQAPPPQSRDATVRKQLDVCVFTSCWSSTSHRLSFSLGFFGCGNQKFMKDFCHFFFFFFFSSPLGLHLGNPADISAFHPADRAFDIFRLYTFLRNLSI